MTDLKKSKRDDKHQLVKSTTIRPEFERYPTFVELEEHLINTESKLNDPSYDKYDKVILKESLDMIKAEVIGRARVVYDSTNYLPSELGITPLIKYCSKKPKKEVRSNIKIDDWSELLIKVFAYRVEFQKKGSSTSQNCTPTELGWNGLKLEIVKEFSNSYCYKRNDQVTSRVSELNKQLCNMFGLEQKPFIYDKRKKMRTTLIDIEIYDANERLLDATLKVDRNVFKNSISDTYNVDYNDDYQHNSIQNHLSLSDIDEDDRY